MADLRPSLAGFDPTLPIARSRTPPTSWYVDETFYKVERAAVFGHSWQVVGLARDLEDEGAFITGQLGPDPVVVVRHEGTLRGFHNVCRHHAACVAVGQGRTEQFVCPYHGWRYGLDGRLQSAPRMAGMQGFDRAALSLPQVAVAAWGPYVLVHRGTPPRPLEDELRTLTERLDATGWSALQYHSSRSYRLACNWKVYVDNYLDGGYHVPHAHTGLAAQLDLDAYRSELFATYSIQSTRADPHDDEAGDFAARLGDGALYAWVFPNLMLNRYGPILDTNRVIPDGPDACEVVYDFFFTPAAAADEDFVARSLAASHRVQEEDIALCDTVQRGLRSSSYERGWYAPQVEAPMHQFHCLLHGALTRALAAGEDVVSLRGRA